MDEESFTHPEVIRQLNRDFIAVRVDSDKRPEINLRYNMGGWPTVAVLDGGGEPLAGATYLPAGELLRLLAQHAKPPPPEKANAGPRAAARQSSAGSPPLEPSLIDAVGAWLERAYDRTFGGFGSAPKFPQPWAVEFALRRHARTGEDAWRTMAAQTLDQMQESELYDPIDGGFFRYAAAGDWSRPHDEKLLDLNAQLASLYLRASALFDNAAYRATAQTTLDYLFATLAVSGRPWFGGSQSADRDYYALSQEARLDADAPFVDQTLYVDRNAMAASTLFTAARLMGRPDYRASAVALIEHLWTRCRRPDGAMFHYDDGAPAGSGLLTDQAWMMTALLDQHEDGGDSAALERAQALAASMSARLWDSAAGGYWDLPADPETGGLLRVRLKPLTENAAAALALMRLARLTDRQPYREQAEQTLRYAATIFHSYKHYSAPFGVALDEWFHPSAPVLPA